MSDTTSHHIRFPPIFPPLSWTPTFASKTSGRSQPWKANTKPHGGNKLWQPVNLPGTWKITFRIPKCRYQHPLMDIILGCFHLKKMMHLSPLGSWSTLSWSQKPSMTWWPRNCCSLWAAMTWKRWKTVAQGSRVEFYHPTDPSFMAIWATLDHLENGSDVVDKVRDFWNLISPHHPLGLQSDKIHR